MGWVFARKPHTRFGHLLRALEHCKLTVPEAVIIARLAQKTWEGKTRDRGGKGRDCETGKGGGWKRHLGQGRTTIKNFDRKCRPLALYDRTLQL